jgi:hypothetical protein
VSERLLVLEPVGDQGALGAGADVRDVDPAVGSRVATYCACWAMSIAARG